MDIVDRLLEDALHHDEIATSCDCRPEDTLNHIHACNAREAASEIIRLREMVNKETERAMTPTEKIDAALDSVLIQSGYTINFFGNPARREAMRAAMKKIMTDEYKAGSDAAHEAMKGR